MDRDLSRAARSVRLRAAGTLAAGALVAGSLLWLSPPARAVGGTVSDCPTTEAALVADIGSAAGGTLEFTCTTDTTITFDEPITVSQDVSLDASGATGKVVFDGNGGNLWDGTMPAPDPLPTASSLLVVAAGSELSVTGVTLQHAAGLVATDHLGWGAIDNQGTLDITDCTFADNAAGALVHFVDSDGTPDTRATGGRGGAIYNEGAASVRDSTFTGNTSTYDAGAIYNTGMLSVAGNDFDGNSTTTGSGLFGGGAILNDHGTVTVASGNSFIDNVVNSIVPRASEGGAIAMWGGSVSVAAHNTFAGNVVRLADTDPAEQYQFRNALGMQFGSLRVDGLDFTGMGAAIGIDGGALTVANSTFHYQNVSGFEDAAAIAESDQGPTTVTLTGDSFTGFPQGALASGGEATITDSTFTGNGTADGAHSAVEVGGGTITGSTFRGNSALHGGAVTTYRGAVVNDTGKLTITGSTFEDNHGRLGGAVFNQQGALLAIRTSRFIGNTVTGAYYYQDARFYPRTASGGAVANRGSLTVADSTFSANTAPSTDTGGGEVGAGGAIYDELEPNDSQATVDTTVSASTFTGNSAGAGAALYSDYHDTMTVTNSTFAGNTATGGARYGKGLSGTSSGGAVEGIGSSIVVRASTFDANAPAAMGGFDDGTFSDPNPYWTLGQNLFADPVVTGSCSWSGRLLTAIDLGHNLFTGPTTCVDLTDGQGAPVTGAGDLTVTDAKLDAAGLANNGGPTQTIALQADSPAIAAVPPADCQATDQRGHVRPGNATKSGCDIGAFEFSVADTATGLTTDGSGPSVVGQPVTYTATVTSASTTPDGAVTFRDGDSTISACTDVALVSGTATCRVTYAQPGVHAVTAAYEGTDGFSASSSDAVTHEVWYAGEQLGDPPTAKPGSGVPIKVAVQAYQDGALTNVSATSIAVTALCVVPVGAAGCANPTMSLDTGMTYVAKLDRRRGGYQLTLHPPKSMSAGSYAVLYRAAGEPTDLVHSGATFVIQSGGGGHGGHGGH